MPAEKFETGLKKIEALVHKLEGGEISLEDSIKAFEEGMKLVKLCEEKLSEAQKKIDILTEDKGGKRRARPYPTEETV